MLDFPTQMAVGQWALSVMPTPCRYQDTASAGCQNSVDCGRNKVAVS